MTRPRTSNAVIAGAIAALAALAIWNAAYFFPATVDDAFISLRYAWNLVHGAGLVYNPGERVEGYSNPSWTLLGAAWIALGADPLTALKWSGLLLTALLPAATAWTGRQAGLGRVAALGAAAMVACDINVAFWAPNGLETPLWTLALTLFIGACARRWEGREGWPLSAAIGAFLYVTRPEAPLFLAPALLWELARARTPVRARLTWVATLALPCLGWLAFRWVYYGDWVANTYYVKANLGFLPQLFGPYLASWLAVSSPITGLLLPIGAALALTRPGRRIVLAALVVQFLFVLRAGADWMMQNRFWVPAVPMAAVLVTGGAEQVVGWTRSRAAGWAVGAVAAVLLAGQAWRHLGAEALYRNGDSGKAVDTPRWSGGPKTMHDRVFSGVWTGVPDRVLDVLLTVPDGATIAHSEIGLLGYATDHPILDAYGLCDRRLSGATGEPLDAVLESLTPPDVLLRRPNIPFIDAMTRTSWYQERGYAERNRWKDAWIETPGGPDAGALPPLADDAALARLVTATHRVPREIRFQAARIEVARRVSPAALAAACADATVWFPTIPGCGGPATPAAAPATALDSTPDTTPDTPNLGFEAVTGTAPDGWTPVPGEATAWRVVEPGHSGAHAVEVSAPLWVCSPWAPVRGPIRIWGARKHQDISAGANPRQGAAVAVRLERPDKTQESPTIEAWTGTADWTPFDVQFPATAEFSRYRACVGINAATGTAWFDDVAAASR